jgi:hypothetical protein
MRNSSLHMRTHDLIPGIWACRHRTQKSVQRQETGTADAACGFGLENIHAAVESPTAAAGSFPVPCTWPRPAPSMNAVSSLLYMTWRMSMQNFQCIANFATLLCPVRFATVFSNLFFSKLTTSGLEGERPDRS